MLEPNRLELLFLEIIWIKAGEYLSLRYVLQSGKLLNLDWSP
jgi:hypothetical protein